MANKLFFITLASILLLSFGCGGGSTGPETPTPTASNSYFPLAVGNRWVYRSYELDDDTGEEHPLSTISYTLTRMVTFLGEVGFETIDTVRSSNPPMTSDYQLIRMDGGEFHTTTLHQAPVTDGDWGGWYMLYVLDPARVGFVWDYSTGVDLEVWREVHSSDTTVATAVDTFPHCIDNLYVVKDSSNRYEYHHLFAPDVGEVLEERFVWHSGELGWHYRRELVSSELN